MKDKNKKPKKFVKVKITFSILLGLILLMCVGMGGYLSDYYHSKSTLSEYQEKYENDGNTQITEEDQIITIKSESTNRTGIIFYPGGKVEYTAYVPLLVKFAEKGYTCYLPKMPGNLAVFGINKADEIISEQKDINTWYIGGHSLGGAMSSSYASTNEKKLAGIFFLGAYPSSDLSQTNLKMISLVGSKDQIINKENYEKNKVNAPENSIYETIDGGNHGGFGDYGVQKADGEPSISGEEQQKITAEKIDKFIQAN